MKITLPDSYEDITLRQYQELVKLDDDEDGIFSFFTGIDLEDVKNVEKKQKDEVLKHIEVALQQEGEFKSTFIIDGIEFGLIPNFDKITGGTYSDLVKYSNSDTEGENENLDRLLAVLYRPIKKKDSFGNYEIKDYEGTSGHLEQINKLPMSIVNGCLGFFLTLSEDLETHIQKYMEEEQPKEERL